jgi:outer membrane lipoprotein SlyB
MKFIRSFIVAFVALTAFVSLPLVPTAAYAQQSSAAPRIDGFDVEQIKQLTPGSELLFTLYGTPGGSARVRITGAVSTVLLEESEPGVYEGTYAIRTRDKITPTSTATANLRLGNRVATALLDEPLVLAGAPRPPAPPSAALPRIDRFGVQGAPRLVTGEDLIFTLYGTPGGEASLRIAGVKGKIDLPEVKPGLYEGAYIIKSRDRVGPEGSNVTATLRVANQTTSATLGQSLIAGPGAPPRQQPVARTCLNCGVVEAINPVEVQGKGSYIGMIAGGAVGALLGTQVGSGRGTTAAEIAGAAGGALLGNEAEKRIKTARHFDVVVRLDGGGTQTVSYPTAPSFRVGDRVKVENNTLVPNP